MTKLNYQADKGKRKRLINSKEVMIDLSDELPLLFQAYNEAVMLFKDEVVLTPIEARGRGFEAMLLNTKITMCIQKYFPDHWKRGKYKRFFLRVNSYILLFKKLNSKNLPMNIRTKNSISISNQQMGSLFGENEDGTEPILFFGYKKGAFGEILEAKLVYIDENRAKWEITQNDINQANVIELIKPASRNRSLSLKDKDQKSTGTN